MDVDQLMEIEQIKQLKARYFRLMDKKLWDQWGDVFTVDATLQYGPGHEEVFEGKKAIIGGISEILKDSYNMCIHIWIIREMLKIIIFTIPQ